MTTAQRLPATRPRITKAAKIIEASIVTRAPRSKTKTLFDFLQKPGYYNAQAKVALLRRSKAGPLDDLFVDFSQSQCHIVLQASGTTLLEGPWEFQATADGGESLTPIGAWEESCWERDDACDYLEIELPLTGTWRLKRQMLLARQDRFLLLADALIGPMGAVVNALRGVPSAANTARSANGSPQRAIPTGACELHYAGSLVLAAHAAFRPAAETREGWLEAKNRRQSSVAPLALPEWRAEFCHAELSAAGGRLSLEQKSLGRNLYAPLWIDLDPRRLKQPLTWRRLTVAENLATVPRDVVAAYRVQVGREQWLFYRSLAKRGNRTFLGHNTLCSFTCRRLLASGETEDLVEIE